VEQFVCQVLVPVRELRKGSYLCDKRFHVEDFYEFFQPLDEKQQHGLVLGNGDTMEFYILNGTVTRLIKTITVAGGVRVKHHKKGGQSSLRFSRIHENQTDAFVKSTAETCNSVFVDADGRPSIVSLCFGGTGGDVTGIYAAASRSPHLKKELSSRLVCPPVSASSLAEVVNKTDAARSKFVSNTSDRYVLEFLDHVNRATGRAVYGTDEVKQHMQQLEVVVHDPETKTQWTDVLQSLGTKTKNITSTHPAVAQYGGLVAIAFFPITI
jgi:peptide chain release factor subunit 1